MREIEAWCAAQHAGLVTQLRPVDSFPEKTIADAAKTSLGQAARTTERADALAAVAAAATVDQFAKRLEHEARQLDTDDGSERLEHQRRLARARTWVDPEGMWNLTARLALDIEVGTRPGRSEFVAVIDADAPGERGPVIEFAIPVELPARVLAALYSGCSIPGCTVAYDRCKLHHIVWWRNDGTTDLANLLPVCSVHHAKIHHDGWVVELGQHRELTLRLPDGTIRTTGPPTRRQSAA